MFLHFSNSKLIARLGLSAALAILPLLGPTVMAQDGYKKAPPEVSSILSAPVTPIAFVSPARDAMLLATSLRYPPLAGLTNAIGVTGADKMLDTSGGAFS